MESSPYMNEDRVLLPSPTYIQSSSCDPPEERNRILSIDPEEESLSFVWASYIFHAGVPLRTSTPIATSTGGIKMKLVKNSKQPIPRESYGPSNVCFETFCTQNPCVCHRVGVDGMLESNLGMVIATSTIYSILGLESSSIIRLSFSQLF
jgi:hypothetical protein